MPISKFHYRLLKFIYKHPYIKGKNLKTFFMLFKRHRYNDRHFINALESLCRSGYVECTFFQNASKDTGQRLPPSKNTSDTQSPLSLLSEGVFIPEDKSIYNDYRHYLTTELGAYIVEAERKSWFRTWVPWGVTTIIALASLIVSCKAAL